MVRTRVKICGITRLEDARLAVSLGVDALGFVFVPASARHVTVEAARDIARRLPPFVARVGLFLDASRETVERALDAVPELVPQFHGRETATECDAFGRGYLKALGVAGGLPAAADLAAYRRAEGFLLDSNVPGELGGTGHTFDWTRLSRGAMGEALGGEGPVLILAGGLDAGNVGRAIREVRPYALDVSSGVESAKGIKDARAMRSFMAAVRRADAERSAATGGERDDVAPGATNTTTRGTRA